MKRKSSKRARATTSSNKRNGVVGAAVGAAVELGHAAEKLQESWKHVKEAQRKGHRVTNKAKQVGKKAIKSAKRMVGARR